MSMRYVVLYFIALTIPMFLGLTAWQSVRYAALEKQTKTLEQDQEKWVEKNKRLIADIAAITSSGKVEEIAVKDLGLKKILPENVLQIWIERK